MVTELADGSYLSVLLTDIERQRIRRHRARGLRTVPERPTVRVIEYDIANRDTHSGTPIRLITTILDPEVASASELAAVYHQRWEFESSLAEIETRQRGSYRVLHSHSPEMVRQEIWALLLSHYAIRALMHESTDPEGLDPLRISFVRTLRIVRRHVTGQAGFSPDRLATAEILQRPNPARRHRTYPRVTKRASRTKFPRKTLDHNNINHRGPPDIRLNRLQSQRHWVSCALASYS